MRLAEMVSIVVTSYNHAAFLAEAIASALAQTHSDIEFIVVDDGSTDQSLAVASGFTGVKCIAANHPELSSAPNIGLRASTGAFLIFLAADDRLAPAAVEAGLSSLDAHPECGFVSGHYAVIDGEGVRVPFTQAACQTAGTYESLLRRNHIGMHAAVMYRREVLDYTRGFDQSMKACEDYNLFLRASREFNFCCHH